MKTKLTARLVDSLKPNGETFSVRDTETVGFFLRITPKGVMTYYVDYRLSNGGRKSYRIGPAANITTGQARTIAKKFLGDVADGNDPQARKVETRRKAEMAALSTLGAFFDHKYEPWLQVERKSGPATITRLRSCFGEWADMPMTDITPWHVEKWRANRKKAGIKPTTINRDVVALKAALQKAVDWGVIEKHRLADLKPEKTDDTGRVRYLDLSEEETLRKSLRKRDDRLKEGRRNANKWRAERGYPLLPDIGTYADHLEPLVLLAMNTGMRRGELFNLLWTDISLDREILTIRGTGAKSNKTRHVPLNIESLRVLTAWNRQRTESAYVFPGKEGKRLGNIKTSWGSVIKISGINDFTFHDLRHHFASRLVMSGVDLNTVRELLGHADIKMTLRYAHLAPEHKAAAVRMLDRPANNVTTLPALEA